MAQAVSRRPLTAEARVRGRVDPVWDLWWKLVVILFYDAFSVTRLYNVDYRVTSVDEE